MRKALWLIFLLVFLSTLFFAKTPKDTLVIAANTDILITLDPGAVYEVLGGVIVDACYDKLVDLEVVNGVLTPSPEVAESWDISEDGRTYTFHIRKGIKFTSGRELTADDVIFTLKRHLKMEKPSSWMLPSLGINKENMEDTIKKLDDYTVQLTFEKPYSPNMILGILTFDFTGVVDKEEVLKHEIDGDLGEAWLTDHSAGSGPFYLESWERNTHVILRANKNYWGEKPKLSAIIFRDVPESTTQRLLLEKGDVDVAWNLLPENIEELKTNKEIRIVSFPGHEVRYLAMNSGWGPFKDPRVRLAVKYAIDYDCLIREIKKGYAIKVQGFIMKGYFGFVSDTPFEQNIEKAKQLLTEAGYPDGFEVEFLTGTEWQEDAVKIQADLAKVGIKANLVVMQRSQMYAKYRQQGHQMVLARWGSDYPDPDALAKPFADYTTKSLAWRNMWYDEYASQLTKKAAFEKNPDRRAQIYEDLTEYWFLNGPFAILYQVVSYWAIRDNVKGFEEAAEGFSLRFDFSKIYKE